jgi:triosephosphate isomerase
VREAVQLRPPIKFIYGGSVNKDNIKDYLQCKEIDGFLIGGASLDPTHFYSIVSMA